MELLKDPRVDIRNAGYYVPGLLFSLETIVYALREGQSVEQILEEYSALGHFLGPERAREAVEGMVAFIREHPEHIEEYLEDGERRWEEFKRQHPNPPKVEALLRQLREEKGRKSA